MNKRGLTLVELLAVLVVMSLIAIIVYPNVNGVIKGAKEDLSDVQVNSIKESAQLYLNDRVGDDEFFSNSTEEVSLFTLMNDGYIVGDTYNILNGKDFNLKESKVVITKSGEYPNYKYEFTLDLVDE